MKKIAKNKRRNLEGVSPVALPCMQLWEGKWWFIGKSWFLEASHALMYSSSKKKPTDLWSSGHVLRSWAIQIFLPGFSVMLWYPKDGTFCYSWKPCILQKIVWPFVMSKMCRLLFKYQEQSRNNATVKISSKCMHYEAKENVRKNCEILAIFQEAFGSIRNGK